ncbi:MAG: LysR family transcriptional regulator [Actinomycetota bacterium]
MIDLSLVQLRMLREVARRGTMAAAADALGYTPSAISQQLAHLQQSAGVDLFERVGRNVHLTDAGYDLARRADTILGEVEAAGAALESSRTDVRGVVHVGLFESVATALLPSLLTRLAADHPDLEVRTTLADPGGAVDALSTGELDLAFSLEYDGVPWPLPDRLHSDHLRDDPFHLVVPTGHRIADGPVRLGDVADEPFIGSSPESPCGRLMMAACDAAGFRPDVVHRFDDYRTVLALVSAGHGISLVPELGLCDVPSDVRVLPLAEPVVRRIVLTCRSASADRPAIAAVRRALCCALDDTLVAA